ncbi:MAG: protein-disulfide reductase DsbD domain-containing protein [Pyrinomonadaceae bacterium]
MKLLVIFSAIFVATTLFSSAAIGQTFTGRFDKDTVTRGDTARGRITMVIPAGLHVNSNHPSSQYAIATALRISGSGMKSVSIAYPRGKDRKFQFSEDAINVYEGRVTFGFAVKVPQNLRGRFLRLRASVRYQACTEEVCYPPKTKVTTLTVPVK